MSSGTDTPGRGPAPGGRGPQSAFDALSEPVRREILALLAEETELSVTALADRISSVGRTAVSMHLRVLRHAGLVSERRAGNFRFYSVDTEGSAREVLVLLRSLFESSLGDVASVMERRADDAPGMKGTG